MRLIDADALVEKLKSLHGHGDFEANMYCAEACYGLGNWVWENPEDYGLEAAEKALKEAPTIEAEPVRHSRWVKDNDGDEYCENCSRYMPVREVTGDPSANNYCPNCGAMMDGDSR